MNHYFAELGLDADADERAVKRAYAARLKLIDVEKDPAAFQALRETFEGALWYARNAAYIDSDNNSDAEEAESAADIESPTSAPAAPAASQNQVDAIIAAVLTNAIAPSFQHTESAPQAPIPKGWASLNSSGDEDVQLTLAVNIVRSTQAVDSREVAASMVTGARQKLASFAAQENFELDVARYIATETGYTAASILGIADAMGWNDDKLYNRDRLATLDANLAYQVEQKLFAARGLNYLHALKDSRHAAGRTLMGKFRPAIFRLWIFDKDELAEFHHFIDEFRWADFSSFSNAPDPRVINWWKEHGRAPRITLVKLFGAGIWGFGIGGIFFDVFQMRELEHLSRHALIAIAITIGIITSITSIAAVIWMQSLLFKHKQRSRNIFTEGGWLGFGWIGVAPISLAFALLRPDMQHWEVPAALCGVTLLWVAQSISIKWKIEEILFSAVVFGIPTASWAHSFFGRPNFLLAYAAALLALYYTLAASRHAQLFMHHESPRAVRLGFNYGWLGLLAAASAFVINSPSENDIVHQASRLLWLFSVIWGVTATTFYYESLKNIPWIGTIGISLFLSASYFSPPVSGTGGFAAAISASMVTVLFFIINRIAPLDAWLQR